MRGGRRSRLSELGPGLFPVVSEPYGPEGAHIYTVSELTAEVKELLETAHPAVYVRGEISNFYIHGASEHMYFSLKDEKAQMRAVFFKNVNRKLKFTPENGMEVIAFGRLTLYEPRGDYQIRVEFLEPAGLGALQMRIEQLKKKLAAEGLFDEARKRPLPEFPHRIALVTSPEGAAIRDFLKVTRTRFPGQHIVIFPVLVQGEGAPSQIVEAIEAANEMGDFDVLVLCRGGGSIEDLMAFNDEGVARAIAGSAIPVVNGVGHERDVTIADFVADVRAATPSQAAEIITPSRPEILARLEGMRERMEIRLRGLVEETSQELDDVADSLRDAVQDQLKDLASRIRELSTQVRSASPQQVLARQRELLKQLAKRAATASVRRLAEIKQRVQALGGKLNALSPLAVLERGYSIAFALPGRAVLKDSAQVAPGQEVEVKLFKGLLRATTRSTEP